jgi:hypothetical protein
VPLRPVEPDIEPVAVAVGLHGIGDVGDGGGPPFGQPAHEFRSRLQRRVRQRFGHDAGAGGSRGIDRAQYVVTDGRRLRPSSASVGEIGERIAYRRNGDGATVVTLIVGQRESRVVGRRSDRDDYTARKFCHEYLLISSCL